MTSPYTSALVTLATRDLDKLVTFYRQLFRQEPHPYHPNVYAEFQISGLRLGIFRPRDTDISEFANARGSTISLCLEVNDLEATLDSIQQLYITADQAHDLSQLSTSQIIFASHGREIYIYDPDGHRLILYQTN